MWKRDIKKTADKTKAKDKNCKKRVTKKSRKITKKEITNEKGKKLPEKTQQEVKK